MLNFFAIIIGKVLLGLLSCLRISSGSTWPGHIILKINKNFLSETLKTSRTKIILIAGTNGKTTTGKLIEEILKQAKYRVFINKSGANLLNGMASSISSSASLLGKLNYDFAIFEVDENIIPLVMSKITPDYIIALNLFRDQLDRYGEVDNIAKKWNKSFKILPSNATLILNADDPLISHLGKDIKAKTLFFGISNNKYSIKQKQNAADSIYCPCCNNKLKYNNVYFAHLGDWFCPKCNKGKTKPESIDVAKYPLPGTYNVYNTLASVLIAKTIGITKKDIDLALSKFKPAFGRQEKIKINNKTVQLFLSKNPTSFNESLRTIKQMGGNDILIVLNDRIPDGRDISWIWDIDTESQLSGAENIMASGDRTYDMALRLKYCPKAKKINYEPDLKLAIKKSLSLANKNLFILPTYSAMLDVRKILTGRKIL